MTQHFWRKYRRGEEINSGYWAVLSSKFQAFVSSNSQIIRTISDKSLLLRTTWHLENQLNVFEDATCVLRIKKKEICWPFSRVFMRQKTGNKVRGVGSSVSTMAVLGEVWWMCLMPGRVVLVYIEDSHSISNMTMSFPVFVFCLSFACPSSGRLRLLPWFRQYIYIYIYIFF